MSWNAARFLSRLLVPATIFAAACSVSPAQEVIHALTGVATKVDSSTHTITLTENDGTQSIIKDDSKSHPRYDFDKALESSATASSDFDKQGDRVILYYFGDGWQRRAVAVKDLGPAPMKIANGVVKHWDRHHHVITIKAADGTTQTFQLDASTAVDTPTGVVNGDRFDPQNGDQISIKYVNKDQNNEAVFLNEG